MKMTKPDCYDEDDSMHWKGWRHRVHNHRLCNCGQRQDEGGHYQGDHEHEYDYEYNDDDDFDDYNDDDNDDHVFRHI